MSEREANRNMEWTAGIESTSKLPVPNTVAGGVGDRKTNQKISPPKKRR